MQPDFALMSTPPADISAGAPRIGTKTGSVQTAERPGGDKTLQADDHRSFTSSLREAVRSQEASRAGRPNANNERQSMQSESPSKGDNPGIEDRPADGSLQGENPQGTDMHEGGASPTAEECVDPPEDLFGRPVNAEDGSTDDLSGLLAAIMEAVDTGLTAPQLQPNGPNAELKTAADPAPTLRPLQPAGSGSEMTALTGSGDKPSAAPTLLDAGQSAGGTKLAALTDPNPLDISAGTSVKPLATPPAAVDIQSYPSSGELKPALYTTQADGQRTAPVEAEETGDRAGRQTEMSAAGKGLATNVDPAEQFADPAGRPVKSKEARPQADGMISRDAAPAKSVELSAAQQAVLRSQGESLSQPEADGKSVRVAVDDTAQRLYQQNPSANRDGSPLYHQEQGFDRTLESVSAGKDKEAAPAAWRAQTLDQIVAKAVYQLKNGLNEVKIDLRPEFLGQVRLHVITENQQVTVRIFAELPLVKDMIENSLQQLKADLQQQGLEIDGLEVFTSSDSHRGEQKGDKLAGRAYRSAGAVQSATDAETTAEAGLPRVNRRASGAVDTFA